jgi:hypothetical protein
MRDFLVPAGSREKLRASEFCGRAENTRDGSDLARILADCSLLDSDGVGLQFAI